MKALELLNDAEILLREILEEQLGHGDHGDAELIHKISTFLFKNEAYKDGNDD